MEYKIREKLFGANKTSAIGTSLTLNDTVKYPINKLTINGVCEQKTTTGKNLLDYVSNLITSNNGLTSVINDDGSITTSGKPTSNYSTIIKTIDITDILEDKSTYTISQSVPANLFVQINLRKSDGTLKYVNSNRGSYSFIVDKSIYSSYTLAIQTTSMETWGDSSLTITNKYMLCKGTDAADTSFEPYTNKKPSPSPDFSQEIKTITGNIKVTSCGKNLLNIEDYTKSGDTSILSINNREIKFTTSSNARYEQVIYFKNITLKANKTYTIVRTKSNEISSTMGQVELYKGSSWIKVILNSDKNSNTFTVDEDNVYRIRIKLSNANQASYTGTISDIMVSEVGGDYEPYQDSSLNITIPSNEFVGKLDDTCKDTLNVVYKEDRHYHLMLNKMIGKCVLDGSEKYTNSGLSSNNYIYMMKTIINDIKSAVNDDEFVPVMSNYFSNGFSYRSLGYSIAGTNGIVIAQNNTLTICHSNYTKENTEGFKNWLSTHNTEVFYPLAKPYEVDLGIVDQLLTFDEITNIFTDSDLYPVINVDYYKGSLDISNYEFSIKEV